MGMTIDKAIEFLDNYKKIKEKIKSELCFDNPNFSVENMSGLSRALEIFKEIEDGKFD